MDTVRPLLACTIDNLELLKFPVLVSAKLDGIRCVIDDGTPITRNGKPIRNLHIQNTLAYHKYSGLDGELIVGPPSGPEVFNRTTSGVMSQDGAPDFTYWVFDNHLLAMQGFRHRYKSLNDFTLGSHIRILPHSEVRSLDELKAFEETILGNGFEGVMIRRMDGPYKQGRSTLREGILLRLKRFKDSEAKILRLEEGQFNLNEATRNPLGYIDRSTHKVGMQKANRVGTLIAQDIHTGQEIRISPGKMTQEQRSRYWALPLFVIGRVCKYKFFDYGVIEQPRFATFQAFVDGQP